jgi:hypothetical protein
VKAALKRSNGRGRAANELGADKRIIPPDYLVHAILLRAVAGETKHKFVGYFQSIGINPHAALREVDDEAVARWTAVYRNHGGQAFQAVTQSLASFAKWVRRHHI